MQKEKVLDILENTCHVGSIRSQLLLLEAEKRVEHYGSLSTPTHSAQEFGSGFISCDVLDVLESWLIDTDRLPVRLTRHMYEQAKLFVLNSPPEQHTLEQLSLVRFIGEKRALLMAQKLEKLGYINLRDDGVFVRLREPTYETLLSLAKQTSWKYNRCDTEILKQSLFVNEELAQKLVKDVAYIKRCRRKDLSVPRKAFEAMLLAGDYSWAKNGEALAFLSQRTPLVRPVILGPFLSIQLYEENED